MSAEDLDLLLLEAEIQDDPEELDTLTDEEAQSVRHVVNGTKSAIAASPENRDKSEALATIPTAEISQQTGIALENVEGMIDAIWQIEQAHILTEETKREQYRQATRLKAKSDILKQELTAKINRLNSIASFDPYAILGTNPEQERDDLNAMTANALDLANSILQGGKLSA